MWSFISRPFVVIVTCVDTVNPPVGLCTTSADVSDDTYKREGNGKGRLTRGEQIMAPGILTGLPQTIHVVIVGCCGRKRYGWYSFSVYSTNSGRRIADMLTIDPHSAIACCEHKHRLGFISEWRTGGKGQPIYWKHQQGGDEPKAIR